MEIFILLLQTTLKPEDSMFSSDIENFELLDRKYLSCKIYQENCTFIKKKIMERFTIDIEN